jgi:hypothetical protein
MQRTFQRQGGRPVVMLADVSARDEQHVNEALDAFRASTRHAIQGMIDLLRDGFAARCLSADAIERLSKWANSGGTYASAVGPACRVARLLLGCSLERLIAEDGTRVPDYDARVTALGRRVRTA